MVKLRIMSEENYKIKATDPAQYDLKELKWENETIESPVRVFFRDYLKENLGILSGKKIIDIGSGTGYLTKLYQELGAQEIFGVEPSRNNVEVSRKMNPGMTVVQSSLEDLVLETRFDIAVSVMVFEHIADPESALKKVFNILKAGGLFFFIFGDMDYHKTSRFDSDIEVQNLENNEIATKTKRPNVLMYDIFRPVETYIKGAQEAGFSLEKHIKMVPTQQLLVKMPRYIPFKDTVITHLFVLRK